jgi:hypothetical protein
MTLPIEKIMLPLLLNIGFSTSVSHCFLENTDAIYLTAEHQNDPMHYQAIEQIITETNSITSGEIFIIKLQNRQDVHFSMQLEVSGN